VISALAFASELQGGSDLRIGVRISLFFSQ
jgi:hypothetical protein